MSLLSDLSGEVGKAYDSKAPGWLDAVLNEARRAASGQPDPRPVNAALAAVGAQRATLLPLGKIGLLRAISHLSLNHEQAAVEEILKHLPKADVATLVAASMSASSAVNAAKRADDEAKAAALQALRDITVAAAKVAIPFLLAAI